MSSAKRALCWEVLATIFLPFLNCLFSASRGKVIDRIPLPPPRYGGASFVTPKPPHSDNFYPSAPSSSGHDSVSQRSQPAADASDNHVTLVSLRIMSYKKSYSSFECPYWLYFSVIHFSPSFAPSALQIKRIWHLAAVTRYTRVNFDISISQKYIS